MYSQTGISLSCKVFLISVCILKYKRVQQQKYGQISVGVFIQNQKYKSQTVFQMPCSSYPQSGAGNSLMPDGTLTCCIRKFAGINLPLLRAMFRVARER